MGDRANLGPRSAGQSCGSTRARGALRNRVGAVAVLPDVLRDLGLDPAEVYAAAQVDIAVLTNPEALAPIADLARLVSVSLRASNRSDLGLLIADRARADRVGVLGDLFLSADDLRSALNDLIRFFHISTRGGVAMLRVDGPIAEVQLAFTGPYGDAASVFEDAIVGILFHVMRKFLGAGWCPSEVLLSHARRPDREAYRRFFGVPVRFNALCTAIVFPANDLSLPMIAWETDRRRLETAATGASEGLAIGFDERVRWAIRARLGTANLTIAPIAHDLGMSRRTLNRRLAERGLTFAALLLEVRFATARRLLADSDTHLAEIATAIGYRELSTFSNAFRAWSGAPPRDWRRRHGLETPP